MNATRSTRSRVAVSPAMPRIRLTSPRLVAGLGSLFLSAALSGSTGAQEVQTYLPPGDYAKKIDTIPLSDPSGTTHTQQEVKGKVVVAIFSAPNMSQGGTQEKWSKLLAVDPDTKLSDSVALVLIEDMSQAGAFKGIALNNMKAQFTPQSRPFLILDQTGDILKRFGVPRGKTAILIYDKRSTLRDVELDLSNQDLVLKRVTAITGTLLNE
jgi:hypothetical protein